MSRESSVVIFARIVNVETAEVDPVRKSMRGRLQQTESGSDVRREVRCLAALIPLLLVSIFPVGCVSSPAAAPEGKLPGWIAHYPVNPNYFIGVGGSPDTGDRQGDLERARAKALAQLASEIEVTVRSDQTIRESETSRGVTTGSVDIIVQTLTSQNLEGVELVDSYRSPREGYWFYFRLERRAWDRLKNKDMYSLRDRVLGLVTQAESPGGSIAERLRLLSSALGMVAASKYAGTITNTFDGVSGVLDDFIRDRILGSLSKITLRVEPAAMQYSPGRISDIRIQAVSGERAALGILPLEIRDPDGGVLADLRTDGSGFFSGAVPFKSLKAGTRQVVIAFSAQALEGADRALIQLAPRATMQVEVLPLGVHVQLTSPDDLDARWLEDSISSILMQRFALGVLREEEPSPYRISFRIRSRDAPENDYGILISYCSASLSVTRGESQIAAFSSPDFKGAGLSREQALRNSAKAMLDKLSEDPGFTDAMTTLMATAWTQQP